MLDDLLLQHIRRWQVVQVFQAVILQPEDVQARLIAGDQFVVGKELEALGFLARMPVFGVVANDEILQVVEPQLAGLEGEVLVRAQVVEPHTLRMHPPILWRVVEEHHVGLHALGVEDAGGQPQNGVHIAVLQQLAADLLAGAAFEEHVVGQHHRGLAIHLERCGGVSSTEIYNVLA